MIGCMHATVRPQRYTFQVWPLWLMWHSALIPKEKIGATRRNHVAPLWPPPGFPQVSAPAGIPDEWLAGAARLPTMARTRDYPAPAWRQLMIDAERFLDLWGTQAASLGWRDWELFGCHRRAPWGRIQGMGLVLLLRGKEIAALTATEAVLHAGIGARQTYRRKPRDPLHPAERCLIWELQDG